MESMDTQEEQNFSDRNNEASDEKNLDNFRQNRVPFLSCQNQRERA